MDMGNEELQQHLLVIAQTNIEEQYSRKHIDQRIRDSILGSDVMCNKIDQGVELLRSYMGKQYYESKMLRIEQLKQLDLEQLVTEVFIGIAHCLQPQLFTSVAAQMAGRLRFSDKTEAITTVAEVMAMLCQTDAFDICKADRMSSLTVVSRIPLEKELIKFIEDSQYLPPMVCTPAVLENNYSSGYLTHNDSLILGNGNHHDGDICLDVLNLMNNTKLHLSKEFIDSVEETPTFELDTQDKVEQWSKFKKQSGVFYSLLNQYSNEFYLTHKADKRGRIYAQGYHINTQGNAYKKASIELAHKEVVTGVPS